jgi:hypothetical protein
MVIYAVLMSLTIAPNNCAKSGHSGLVSFNAYKLLFALFPHVASHGR